MTNYEQWQVDRYGNILPPSGKLESHHSQPQPQPHSEPEPRVGLDYADLHKVAGMLLKRYEAAKELAKIETDPFTKSRYEAEALATAMHYSEMVARLANILLHEAKNL